MKAIGESATGATVVKFGRTRSGCSNLATSKQGWLVSIGNWHHPACPLPDDTEALLGLLEERGTSVLDEVDGGYVIVWYDTRSDTLTVVPDHLGRLHAYVIESKTGVYLSSSPMALAAVEPCGPDPVAVYELLATGTIWEDRSPFDRVRRLQDTTRYVFRGGRLDSRRRMTALMVPRPGRAPGSSSLEQVIDAYTYSISASLIGHDRLIADLTGGYDTRLLVGFLHQLGYEFDVTVSGALNHRDVRSASGLARSIKKTLRWEAPEALIPLKSSFPTVLEAAARVDGKFDALDYVGIQHVQHVHAESHHVGINGAGGEMWRTLWWGPRHHEQPDIDPIPWVLPRFAGMAVDPQYLDQKWTLDPYRHLTQVLTRSLQDRLEYPTHDKVDHFYVGVRMQNWQGTITSATNEIWTNLTPHLHRRCLDAIFAIAPRERLSCRLANEMFRRFGPAFANCPLETGFPPQNLTAKNVWRFALAARGIPPYLLNVWRERQARKVGIDKKNAPMVRALFASGAADYLRPTSMALLPLFDRRKLESFLDVASRTGEVPVSLVGRLIALEAAFRVSNNAMTTGG